MQPCYLSPSQRALRNRMPACLCDTKGPQGCTVSFDNYNTFLPSLSLNPTGMDSGHAEELGRLLLLDW